MYKQHTFIKAACAGILAIMLPLSNVQAEGSINWVLSGTSPSLDRSTKFLSNGYNDAGIRFANKALSRTNKSLIEEVIAQHNLCIAYSRQAETDMASKHCEAAAKLPLPQVGLKQVKENLYKVKKRGGKSDMFGSLITQNLQSMNSEQVADVTPQSDIAKIN